MDRPTKALSIRQPWAWLIVNGFKDVENRTWPTAFRGRVYVHAGVREDASAFGAGYDPGPWIASRLSEEGLRCWREEGGHRVPFPGGIVGEVDVVDCVTESGSQWFEGPLGFVLANPVAYDTSIPYRGSLGFFEVVLP